MGAPTHEDAVLMVQLAQWGTSLGIEDALTVLFAPDFDPETADMDSTAVRKVLMIGESIGTLT